AQYLALEDPDLDGAHAVSGVRGRLGIIDVGAERVQRHPALAIPFGARDLGAAEAAGAGDADALGAEWTARFIARRNAIRRSSWSATPWATSRLSISGLRISTMFSDTVDEVMVPSLARSFSMSAPFLPMITPGRAA